MSFSKNDLRQIYQHLARLLPPGSRPLSAAEVVEVEGLRSKIETEIRGSLHVSERGARVLSWRVDPKDAPTMNSWGFLKVWQRAAIRKRLEDALHRLLVEHPSAAMKGNASLRWVTVTRYTPNAKTVDEASVDSIGGKMPIDTLVRLGVLAGDSPKYLRRTAHVEPTKRGNTHVLIEVFENAREQVEPEPFAVPPLAPEAPPTLFGPMTAAILGPHAVKPGPKRRAKSVPFGDDGPMTPPLAPPPTPKETPARSGLHLVEPSDDDLF